MHGEGSGSKNSEALTADMVAVNPEHDVPLDINSDIGDHSSHGVDTSVGGTLEGDSVSKHEPKTVDTVMHMTLLTRHRKHMGATGTKTETAYSKARGKLSDLLTLLRTHLLH